MGRKKDDVLTEAQSDQAQSAATATGEGILRRPDGTLTTLGAQKVRRDALERTRVRQAQEQGSLAQKVRSSIDRLTQSEVDEMVRTLTSSATGAQSLLRLLEYAEERGAEGDGE